jgi:3'(2'), 5'-bisphosphate nucleotidase
MDATNDRSTLPTGPLRMPPMSAIDEFAPAIEIARVAAARGEAFAERLRAAGDGVVAKGDASPVTAADLALQALIVRQLVERYGEIPVVGEESTSVFSAGPEGTPLRDLVHRLVRSVQPDFAPRAIDEAIEAGGADGTGQAHWVLDPIDGTRGFLPGQQWCVCLALVRDGEVRFGVAACPRLGAGGLVVAAVPGAGAWAWHGQSEHPQRIRCSTRTDAALVACESPEATERARSRLRALGERLGGGIITRPMESQCKFVLVATGAVDLAVRFASADPSRNRDMVWDYAGAVVFCSEAGAVMTDCDGAPLRFGQGRAIAGNRGILCAADWLHRPAVDACGAVDRDFGALPLGRDRTDVR